MSHYWKCEFFHFHCSRRRIKMSGKLLRVMLLVHAFFRCWGASKQSQFIKMSDAIIMPYVEMTSRSATGFFECAALCNDACWFLKYSGNGSGSGTCELYTLKDAIYSQLRFVNSSNLYKKVYPPAIAFVGISEGKTWEGARDFCQSLGANLAIADSTAKVERMNNIISSGWFWVGGQKIGTTWKWLSGAVVAQTPIDDNNASCLCVFGSKLNDWSCTNILMSVCEFKL
ncbi:uncharacterized protein LOC127855033 [Dreissena polymorpha]|uniref:uncharacterized protein LOC127855033 n=1 Tax=Dreissena polymorpha TaxID=45954 RepID=UPI002264D271|nr:uncharacterized protein LOC127855033 [Dreissena polymorpha]